MKKLSLGVWMVMQLLVLTMIASSQITITIPKIPKIVKDGGNQPTKTPPANSPAAADDRDAFYRDANYPVGHVAVLMRFYDPNLTGNVNMLVPANEAEWRALLDRMTALDDLCRTKYPNVTNDPNYPPNRIEGKPVIWCKIAANRVEYIKMARGEANDERAEGFIRIWRYEIEKASSATNGFVSDLVQRMLFDPTWKTEKFAEVKAAYANEGLSEPSMTMFDAIGPDLQKVREMIDADSKSRTWEQPPHHDVTVENFFKGRFISHPYYKGSTVLKIGGNYSTWRVFKNSLGIPTNQYKRGLFLAKRPGQGGLCQIREWIVKQEYIGGGRFGPMKIEGFGEGGKYAACQ